MKTKCITLLKLLLITFIIFSTIFRVVKCNTDQHKCGLRPLFPITSSFRIVGGKNARPGELPWQVYFRWIKMSDDDVTEPLCGGAIIDKIWILTAAHCVDMYPPEALEIVAGIRNLTYGDNEPNVQVVSIKQIINHEDWDTETSKNDIALLQLSAPLTFNSFIQPICLPSQNERFYRRVCKTSGWGSLMEGSVESSIHLQTVDLPIMGFQRCKRMHRKHSQENIVFKGINICTLAPGGGKDICGGDSGGPLACQSNSGSFVLAGVSSWGEKCGGADSPGVYTDVRSFVSWIRGHIVPL